MTKHTFKTTRSTRLTHSNFDKACLVAHHSLSGSARNIRLICPRKVLLGDLARSQGLYGGLIRASSKPADVYSGIWDFMKSLIAIGCIVLSLTTTWASGAVDQQSSKDMQANVIADALGVPFKIAQQLLHKDEAVKVAETNAVGILPGQGFLPLGNLLTVDNLNPLDFTPLSDLVNLVKAVIGAKQGFADADLINFASNVECLVSSFATHGVLGKDISAELAMGGAAALGVKKANLPVKLLPILQEIALTAQASLLFTRQAGSVVPCPSFDFTAGFNDFFAKIFALDNSLQAHFGVPFDPFLDQQSFLLSLLAIQETVSTGLQGTIAQMTNPVLASGIAGIASSASASVALERMMLLDVLGATVAPFNETVQQIFARISAFRDSLDGPQILDQGLLNMDSRFVVVPDNFYNPIATTIQGLTLSRTPQQVINILTLGATNGIGGFFPKGLIGNITLPTGYDVLASGIDALTPGLKMSFQTAAIDIGNITAPISSTFTPTVVPGQDAITQVITTVLDKGSADTRGLLLGLVPIITKTL